MALILNIESATQVCSVALSDKDSLLHVEQAEEDRSHSEVLTTLIDKAMKASHKQMNQLDAVAISSGPGSYTGLRVGLSTAKGICFALGIPLIDIDTLAILALPHKNKEAYIAPMIDARRMEVYTCLFDAAGNKLNKTHPFIIDDISVANRIENPTKTIYCGNGAHKMENFLGESDIIYNDDLNAKHMIELSYLSFSEGSFVDLAYFEPFYLKSPNITKPKNQLKN